MRHLGGCGKECFKGKCAAVGDYFMADPLQVEETAVPYEVVRGTQGMSARAA
jgi:hypothetical protein